MGWGNYAQSYTESAKTGLGKGLTDRRRKAHGGLPEPEIAEKTRDFLQDAGRVARRSFAKIIMAL